MDASGKIAGTEAGTLDLGLELLVLQPTPFCNLDCDYCYLPDRGNRRRMSDATLAETFRRVFESPFAGGGFTVVWHAGEPLALPVAYYENAFAIIERLKPEGLRIDHSFQTNGTLIDADWVRFFRDHGIRPGISLDGPRDLHDRHRRTRRGGGSFERCMQGLRLLQEHGIDFHVITVITADSLDQADRLFDFYVANGIRQVGFNVEEIEADNRTSSLQGADAPTAYGSFLRRFQARLRAAPPGTLALREFTAAFQAIAGTGGTGARNHQVVPFGIINVDVDGNVATFSPELLGVETARFGRFAFGNLHDLALADILDGPLFNRVHGEIRAGVEACRKSCGYFDICGGGAPGNKLFETGRFDTTETMFCRLTQQTVLNVVLDDMERELDLVG